MQRTAIGFALGVFLAAGTSAALGANSTIVAWPTTIKTHNGFAVLGQAIAAEPGFPKSGTGIDKARYIFMKMDEVAQVYDLKAGTGWPLSQLEVQFYRTFDSDPESAEALKSRFGTGNCGEWAFAFSEILGGAGVVNRPFFGDDSAKPGHSFAFWRTDTAVFVNEVEPDGKISRRVFDVFQAAYRSGVHQPTKRTLREYSDLPLTEADYTETDLHNPYRHAWLADIHKKYVKDASKQELLDPVGSGTIARAVLNGAVHWGGTFADANRSITIKPGGASFTGSLKLTYAGETFERHGGTETWKHCKLSTPTHAACEFTGEYHDPDKSIVTGGTIDMTLVGNTLTRAVTVTVADATWHGPRYQSAVQVGAVLHDTTVRK